MEDYFSEFLACFEMRDEGCQLSSCSRDKVGHPPVNGGACTARSRHLLSLLFTWRTHVRFDWGGSVSIRGLYKNATEMGIEATTEPEL